MPESRAEKKKEKAELNAAKLFPFTKTQEKDLTSRKIPDNTSRKLDNTNLLLLLLLPLNELPAQLNAQQELITSSGVKNSAKTSSSAARVTKSKRERRHTTTATTATTAASNQTPTQDMI
jgi:hypothetical protein